MSNYAPGDETSVYKKWKPNIRHHPALQVHDNKTIHAQFEPKATSLLRERETGLRGGAPVAYGRQRDARRKLACDIKRPYRDVGYIAVTIRLQIAAVIL